MNLEQVTQEDRKTCMCFSDFQDKEDIITRINHIHALLQNKRLQGAREFLAAIDPHFLSEDFRPSFDLEVLEHYCLESNLD